MNKSHLLATRRLTLRPCQASDIGGFLLGLNDWSVAQWLPGPPYPYTEADARDFITATTRSSPPDAYAVATPDGEFMGTLGLARNGTVAELGYWLLPQHQGRGIMSEAIDCLLTPEGTRGLSKIFATVDKGNGASIRLLEKSGLTRVGDHARDTPNRQGNLIVLRYARAVG